MMLPEPLAGVMARAGGMSGRARLVAAGGGMALVAAIIAGAVIAFSGETAGEAPIVIEAITPTATPTAAPTPYPTPQLPSGPVPAERLTSIGEDPGLVNATSIGFPEPPPVERSPVPNDAKVKRMFSPALGIDHYVVTLDIIEGQMTAPEDGNYAMGWYEPVGYDLGTPGHAGNSVFSAHETWNHLQAPLYELHEARVGEYISLEMESGEWRHYQVFSLTRYPLGDLPMREVLWPSDRPENEEWLTIYTCGGEIVYDERGFGDYLERDVLVAKWVGSTYPDPEPRDVAGAQFSEPPATAFAP